MINGRHSMKTRLCRFFMLLFCLAVCLSINPAVFAADVGLRIPDGVTVIGAEAFSEDTSIMRVTIPVSVNTIEQGAFNRCTKLNDVYYSGTTEQWDDIEIQSGNGPLTRATIHFPSPEEPVTLTYAEVNPIDGTVAGDMAKAFKLKVEELSGGSVTIDLQGSGVFGDERTILDSMMSGDSICDLSRISASSLVAYGCEQEKLLSLPYTFSDVDHFTAFVGSDLAQAFLNEPQEIGLPLRSLCFGLDGFRHFFFTRNVNGLADINGLRIRVAMDQITTGMVSDLGARATPMSFSEMYTALQTGVLDGAEQPASNYYSNAFYEVAPYLLLDGHTVGVSQIVISDIGWDKLSPQQQAWVQEAADYASGVCCQRAIEAEQSALQQLAQKGVTIIEVAAKEPWRVKCQPTISANVGDNSDLYQQILNMCPNNRT